MKRRQFTQMTGASLFALTGSSALAQKAAAKGAPFAAKFAPHPGLLFGGKGKKLSYVDQLKLAHDLGFRAWEDNGLKGQKNETIEKIAEFIRDKKMDLGVCVITGGAGAMFNKPTDGQKEKVKAELERVIEVAKITGQTNMTMIPGARDKSMTREEQIKASVDNMKLCCDLV